MKPFLSDLWLLLTLRWTLTFNTFRARKWWQKVLQGFGVAWIAGWLGFLSALIGFGVGSLLRRFPDSGLDALLPGLLLTAVALIILLSSFAIALGSLFLASDLEALMTAPVSRRAVFTAKILDGLTSYYAIVIICAVPALVTYGLGLRYGPLYYLLAIVAVLGTPLLPAGLGALLTMLVARFAPARRVREVLGLVGALIGISFSLIGQTSRIWTQQFANANNDPAVILDTLQRIAVVPIPSLVAGRGLAAAGEGRWAIALVEIVGFLILTVGFFLGSVLIADRLYATGWARMQSAGSASRSRARVARDAANAGWLGRAPAWLAIALKDWRVIPRDLRNFAQLLTPLVLLPIVYINLLSGRGGQRRANDIGNLIGDVAGGQLDPRGVVTAAGILFATALIFRRIASNAISMEGRAWWIMKIAPLDPRELLRGKFAAALIPFAILSTILFVGAEIWQRFSLLGFVYGWIGVELLGAAILATAIGASAPWARLDWDDPKRMSSGWGSLISLTAGIATAGLAGLALCLPLAAGVFLPSLIALAWILGPLLAITIVAATIWFSLSIGAQFLRRVGEA